MRPQQHAQLTGVRKLRRAAESAILAVQHPQQMTGRIIDNGKTQMCIREPFAVQHRDRGLPETVDAANISAKAEDGVLNIEIPKQARPEPKKITVS